MPEANGVPFQADIHTFMEISLQPIGSVAADELAAAIIGMEPWRTLRTDPTRLAAYLSEDDAHSCRRIVYHKAVRSGVVGIRNPWLYGPYLALLVVFPDRQSMGVGSAILQWIEREVQGREKNIWVCVSSFNGRAQSFYRKHGFDQVGTLDGLIDETSAEILMRKRLG
jgi:ribosomal protein S18 acetylase RimI-like enzyme